MGHHQLSAKTPNPHRKERNVSFARLIIILRAEGGKGRDGDALPGLLGRKVRIKADYIIHKSTIRGGKEVETSKKIHNSATNFISPKHNLIVKENRLKEKTQHE